MVIDMSNENTKIEEKYKLYRTVKEIIYPSISKKNITNYKIIVSEKVSPLMIFYPSKISNIENVILYIHGSEFITGSKTKYSSICKKLSTALNSLIICFDYTDDSFGNMTNEIESSIEYLITELNKNSILSDNITLMADSTGATMLSYISNKNQNICKIKQVLFYPALSGEYFDKTTYNSIMNNNDYISMTISKLKDYFSQKITKNDLATNKYFVLKNNPIVFPKTLIIVGNLDPLYDECVDYCKKIEEKNIVIIENLGHGFLKSLDDEIEANLKEKIIDFIQEEN